MFGAFPFGAGYFAGEPVLTAVVLVDGLFVFGVAGRGASMSVRGRGSNVTVTGRGPHVFGVRASRPRAVEDDD